MILSVSHEFLPKSPSLHASIVMDHFGVGFETGRNVIAEQLELPIQPGDIVLFTGASGSGKSSLMRAAAVQLDSVLNIDTLDLGERILVDSFGERGEVTPPGDGQRARADETRESPRGKTSPRSPIREILSLLSTCGLGEAQLLLRTPGELSDGQRYRFRLALGIARQPRWLLADEFTAALDRTLAQVVAFNLRKLATRTGIGFLLATTHEDMIDDLQPDLLVSCHLDGDVEVARQVVKKKPSASATNSHSRPVRSATGRTSLGGITAAITSPLPAM